MRGDQAFYVGGEESFREKWLGEPSDPVSWGALDRMMLTAQKVAPVCCREPHTLDHAFTSGFIERNSFETVSGGSMVYEYDHFTETERKGKLVKDEHATCYIVQGHGLVVISSCGHVGLINTIKQAMSISGVSKLHAVLGGFHLVTAPQEYIERTVTELEALAPDVIIPMHCSGAALHRQHAPPHARQAGDHQRRFALHVWRLRLRRHTVAKQVSGIGSSGNTRSKPLSLRLQAAKHQRTPAMDSASGRTLPVHGVAMSPAESHEIADHWKADLELVDDLAGRARLSHQNMQCMALVFRGDEASQFDKVFPHLNVDVTRIEPRLLSHLAENLFLYCGIVTTRTYTFGICVCQSANEIAARDDAGQASVPDHRDALYALSVEGCRNSFQIGLVRNGCDVSRHHIASRLAMYFRIRTRNLVGIREAIEPPFALRVGPNCGVADQVALADNPEKPSFGIDDRQPAELSPR
jgi:hypothetical protein